MLCERAGPSMFQRPLSWPVGLVLSCLLHAAILLSLLRVHAVSLVNVEIVGDFAFLPPAEPVPPVVEERQAEKMQIIEKAVSMEASRVVLHERHRKEPPEREKRITSVPDVRETAPVAADTVSFPSMPTVPVLAGENALERYGQELWIKIMKHRPDGIRQRGTVLLSFALMPGGALLSAEIARSSGKPQLDQAALAALKEASPFTPPPVNMPGDPRFTISFEFR